MTHIALGALEAHPFGVNLRPVSAFQTYLSTSHPHDCLCFIPGAVPALLPRPESHSP
jgi:hypothetical protein